MASSWDNLVERIFEYPMLTREEERELFSQWKNKGDEKAREKLINSHLRLVLSIACRYSSREEVIIELFEAGLSGLVKTIDRNDKGRFDPNHSSGARLATYAQYEIRGAITNTLQGWRQEKRFFDALSPSAPTVSVDTVIFQHANGGNTITILDTLPTDGEQTCFQEDTVISKLDNPRVLEIVLRVMGEILNPREQIILQERFGDEETKLAVLAKQFGVTGTRICQIQEKAFNKIRRQLQVQHPDLWEAMAVRGI